MLPEQENKKEEKAKRFASRDLIRYLRELSIVVAGIAITFTIAGWIDQSKEKKDVQNYLHAVQLELQENLMHVVEVQEFYEQTVELIEYLYTTPREEYQKEIFEEYTYHIKRFVFFSYKNSAFEMLKVSGAMRLVDEELLKSIWDCYIQLEETKRANDSYTERKLTEVYNSILDNQQMDYEDFTNPKNSRMLYFFMAWGNLEYEFFRASKTIKQTLELFE